MSELARRRRKNRIGNVIEKTVARHRPRVRIYPPGGHQTGHHGSSEGGPNYKPTRRGRRRKREALTKQLRAGKGIGSAGPISTAGVGHTIQGTAEGEARKRRRKRSDMRPRSHSGVPRKYRRWQT